MVKALPLYSAGPKAQVAPPPPLVKPAVGMLLFIEVSEPVDLPCRSCSAFLFRSPTPKMPLCVLALSPAALVVGAAFENFLFSSLP